LVVAGPTVGTIALPQTPSRFKGRKKGKERVGNRGLWRKGKGVKEKGEIGRGGAYAPPVRKIHNFRYVISQCYRPTQRVAERKCTKRNATD